MRRIVAALFILGSLGVAISIFSKLEAVKDRSPAELPISDAGVNEDKREDVHLNSKSDQVSFGSKTQGNNSPEVEDSEGLPLSKDSHRPESLAGAPPSDAAGKQPSAAAPMDVASSEKKHPAFPGIDQKEDILMVSDVRYKEGEGEDAIDVTLTRTNRDVDIAGVVWVIGEYVQRGTTGVMFMPSHDGLKLESNGKASNPRAGLPFQLRTTVQKKMSVRRPGFDGEELVAVRVGVFNNATGDIHMARISMKQLTRRASIKRAKITMP